MEMYLFSLVIDYDSFLNIWSWGNNQIFTDRMTLILSREENKANKNI